MKPKIFAKFDCDTFYQVEQDKSIVEDKSKDKKIDPISQGLYIKPLNKGLALLSDYWKEKYQAKIFLVQLEVEMLGMIRDLRKLPGDEIRASFLMGAGNLAHSVPYLYLREKNEEMLLIADSLGVGGGQILYMQKLLMTEKFDSNMKLAIIKYPSQADRVSCHLYAILFCKESTAVLANGEFKIPHLLSCLLRDSRNKKINGIHEAKLVNALLKGSQISEFTTKNAEQVEEAKPIVIHIFHDQEKNEDVDETLEQFHKRNLKQIRLWKTEKKGEWDVLIKGEPIEANAFLKIKSVKVADLIEIQYFLTEIKKELQSEGLELSKEMEKEFIKGAKAAFKEQGDILTNPNRIGLHKHASEFLDKMLKPIYEEQNKIGPLLGVLLSTYPEGNLLYTDIYNNLPEITNKNVKIVLNMLKQLQIFSSDKREDNLERLKKAGEEIPWLNSSLQTFISIQRQKIQSVKSAKHKSIEPPSAELELQKLLTSELKKFVASKAIGKAYFEDAHKPKIEDIKLKETIIGLLKAAFDQLLESIDSKNVSVFNLLSTLGNRKNLLISCLDNLKFDPELQKLPHFLENKTNEQYLISRLMALLTKDVLSEKELQTLFIVKTNIKK